MQAIKMQEVKILLATLFSVALMSCGGGGGGQTTGPTLNTIAVTPQNPSTATNTALQLAAFGTYSDGSTQNITSQVGWSSSNVVVATVGAGLVAPGTGASAGKSVFITATSGTLKATTTVTFSAPPPTLQSIAVTPQSPSTPVNRGTQLAATGTYSDLSKLNISSKVVWSSANSAVAKVVANTGFVTPAAGASANQTVVITAASGTVSATTTLTLTGIAKFSLDTVADPLALQQWGLRNTGQNGYADTVGTANTGGTLGTDINVDPVYSTHGYTGNGVIVAVVDTGLEIAHEDLSANVVVGGSWNFNDGSTNPTNTSDTTGDHGTSVSGLIAMTLNDKGGIGVAPLAQLKGFNMLSATSPTLADFLASIGGSPTSPNSSDVAIFNQSFGMDNTVDTPVDPPIEGQYASGTNTLRGGKGALYVKSAGNGYKRFGTAICSTATGGDKSCCAAQSLGVSCQNANFDPNNTLPYNIVMAALNAKGTKSSYSTAGSAIWASSPGGEYGLNSAALKQAGYVAPAAGSVDFDPAMVTTDQSGCAVGKSVSTTPTGAGPFSFFNWGRTYVSSINLNCNYTNGMNGTSAAAPMMSGVIALILEANPALTWREVKDILARTAVQVDAAITAVSVTLGNGGSYVAEQAWITNAAGRTFHNWYGFGAVNASAAVDMARTYTSGSLGTFANTVWVTSGPLSTVIADNSTTGASVTLTVPKVGASGIVEAVQIKVSTTATLGYAQDLGIELTSPSGAKSILKNIRDGLSSSNNLAGMVLASNAFYGETSTGAWTVKVVDGWAGGGNQTLTNVQIRVYGH